MTPLHSRQENHLQDCCWHYPGKGLNRAGTEGKRGQILDSRPWSSVSCILNTIVFYFFFILLERQSVRKILHLPICFHYVCSSPRWFRLKTGARDSTKGLMGDKLEWEWSWNSSPGSSVWDTDTLITAKHWLVFLFLMTTVICCVWQSC